MLEYMPPQFLKIACWVSKAFTPTQGQTAPYLYIMEKSFTLAISQFYLQHINTNNEAKTMYLRPCTRFKILSHNQSVLNIFEYTAANLFILCVISYDIRQHFYIKIICLCSADAIYLSIYCTSEAVSG